jgi:hypothetical protein
MKELTLRDHAKAFFESQGVEMNEFAYQKYFHWIATCARRIRDERNAYAALQGCIDGLRTIKSAMWTIHIGKEEFQVKQELGITIRKVLENIVYEPSNQLTSILIDENQRSYSYATHPKIAEAIAGFLRAFQRGEKIRFDWSE